MSTTANQHTGDRLEKAPANAHDFADSKDSRSLHNRAAAEEKAEKNEELAQQAKDSVKPTDIAKSHGNEPSRGAKVDESIENDEAELLKNKGKA